MKTLNRLKNSVAAFAKETRGSIATVFALSSLAVLMAAGAAIDLTRIAHTETVMRDALDAAILAAARDLSDGVPVDDTFRQNFENFFEANAEIRSTQGDSFTITTFDADPETGVVTASAEAELTMVLMGIAGMKQWTVETGSQARFSTDKIEISMVLDVTGSMGRQGKLDSLKLAANDAVDILLPNGDKNNNKVRIGLVPYATSVNAGPTYASAATNGASDKCVVERTGESAYSDAAIGPDSYVGDGTGTWCPQARIRPLTNKINTLKNDIAQYRDDGWTAGHLGVAWGYYMLSEHWQSVWGNSAALAYDQNVQKIMILMTDGEFNTEHAGGVLGDSAEIAVATCTDMKRARGSFPGIKIYSVAFKAPQDAENTLRACASPDTADQVHYFSADNEAELRTAFTEIALSIQKLRLAK